MLGGGGNGAGRDIICRRGEEENEVHQIVGRVVVSRKEI